MEKVDRTSLALDFRRVSADAEEELFQRRGIVMKFLLLTSAFNRLQGFNALFSKFEDNL